MEYLPLAHSAMDSDTDSVRSDVSESFSGSSYTRRPGSGRRKQQLPWRSPWDASVMTDYSRDFTCKEHLPSRTGSKATNNTSSTLASPTLVVHKSVPTKIGSPSVASRRKAKQDLAGPCCHCGAVSSPQWRKGPKGKPILCNACGIRFLRTRTLGKAMPKKRRAAGGGDAADAVNNQPKRIKVDREPSTEGEDVELATDEALATTEDMVCTDDGLEEAYSSPAAPVTQLEYPHAASMPTSRLAIASSPEESPQKDSQQQHGEGSADQQHGLAADEAAGQQDRSLHMADAAMMLAAAQGEGAFCSSSSGSYGQHTVLNPAAAGVHQPLAAGSRHVLLGAGSRLGNSPSLALALALHQQQQQQLAAMQRQYSACSSMQQQPGSPLTADTISMSAAAASPASHSSTHYFRTDQGSDAASYAACKSAPGSPVLGTSSSWQQAATPAAAARANSGFSGLLSMQQPTQQLQYVQLQHQHSLHGPSPLSLVGAANQQQAVPTAAMQQQQFAGLMGMQSLPAYNQADVYQLVRSMAHALGGVPATPAYNLLSAIHDSRAAAAAMAGGQQRKADLQH
ncbi:hypothetical protein COO60DRAFT_1701688 [Scenedesmus sp. NREL 46B-D3]|nr:hypothetical protein COO60DRAFT_1701688 [Scenedesmus sp. NREL 46B-D3]